MKFTVLALLLALVAFTQAELDWSDIKRVQPRNPRLQLPRLPPNWRSPRITGGEEVEPHSLPYQVGLFITADDGTYFCGGSLISTTTVLTAAHCGELSTDIQVVLGAHYIRQTEDSQLIVNVTEVIIHPNWISLLLMNDIAILRIPEIELNENIGIINLPTRAQENETFENDLATVSGWGKDSDDADSISEVLRKVDVPIMTNDDCNIYYLGIIQDTHVCASGADGKSSCSGDSGGPLVINGTQIGIVSFGISLGCEIGWPSAYTRVTKYLDFIEENSDVVSG